MGAADKKQDCRNGAGYCTCRWQGLADSKGAAIGDSSTFFPRAISALEGSIGHANAIGKAISGMIRVITAEQIDARGSAMFASQHASEPSGWRRVLITVSDLTTVPSAAHWSKERNGHGRQTRLRLQQYSAIKVATHAICAPSLGGRHNRPMRVASDDNQGSLGLVVWMVESSDWANCAELGNL